MNLPEDIIVDILSRLPVASLLKFKRVCKSWNFIINDPTFILKHQQTISFEKDSEVLLISRRDNISNKTVISTLRNDTLVDHYLPTFLNEMFGHVRLIGPCNGVVCLYGFPDNIALWNPTIRDFKRLPQSQVPSPPDSRVLDGDLGLGYDPKTRDFKVLQMLFCVSTDSRVVCQVEIYSLRSDSWKKYQGYVPANIMYYNQWSMVFKNERFCWWAQDRNNVEVILSFDMSKKMFLVRDDAIPVGHPRFGGQGRITRALLPMKESLALIVYEQNVVDKVFDVWIVNEFGGNWKKIMIVGPVLRVKKPLGFWNEDGFILENSDGDMVFII